MATIETLKKSESTVYPQTLEKAIYDDEGTRLDNKLSSIKSDIVNIGKYTSTETEIGTWFNGEKLYRLCVYLGTISANSENEHSIGIAVGNIPMVEVFGFQGHRFRRSMKVDFVDKNTGQIKFINDSVVDLYDSVLIVEYIKQ